MADTDSVPWRAPGIRAVYPDLPYDIELLGRHFVAMNNMWQLCYLLADYRVPHPPLPRSSDTERMAAKQAGQPPPVTRLRFRYLRLGTPIELALEVQGGAAIVAIYAIHVIVPILRDPGDAVRWIPRMVRDWHRDWAEAEDAVEEQETRQRLREKRRKELLESGEANVVLYPTSTGKTLELRDYQLDRTEPPMPEVLIEATQDLTDLRPVFIEPVDAGDPPQEIVDAAGS